MKHPAEWITLAVALTGALVTFGVLDEPTAAWITAGLGLVPGIVTGVVEWLRRRPKGS